jgi:hypothetical protein
MTVTPADGRSPVATVDNSVVFHYSTSEAMHILRVAGYRYEVMIHDGTVYIAKFKHKNGTRRSGKGSTAREAVNACLTENIVHLSTLKDQG